PSSVLLSASSCTPATPAPPTLPLHDALPIFVLLDDMQIGRPDAAIEDGLRQRAGTGTELDDPRAGMEARRHQPPELPPARSDGADRKSTRLNSSHVKSSYAVFCLKNKTCPSH